MSVLGMWDTIDQDENLQFHCLPPSLEGRRAFGEQSTSSLTAERNTQRPAAILQFMVHHEASAEVSSTSKRYQVRVRKSADYASSLPIALASPRM